MYLEAEGNTDVKVVKYIITELHDIAITFYLT